MRNLTEKEQQVIELCSTGRNRTDAVLDVYDCSTRNSARVIASRLFKKKLANDELIKKQALVNTEVANELAKKRVKFIDLVLKYCPQELIAQAMADDLICKDRRTRQGTREQFLKLVGAYPDKQSNLVGLFQNVFTKEKPEEPEEVEPLAGNEKSLGERTLEDREKNRRFLSP